ncbi:competence type IV pilus minor pilin ComGD [Sporosarcina sp. 179-K 8C2 HS]|uniref:competence type IV pilus minor pilin ComGD n=1 Tax=Sporosarcina sp. 179-K 8C2 HS TaxID=3142387 RepID=UPI0039A3A055
MKPTNENGFTFLEMLLVLSVVAILTAVILPIGDRWITKQSEEEALYTFIATIHHAQAYAMANETYTAVRFRNSGKSYSLFAPSSVTYSTIDFPGSMYWLSGGNRISAVEFHPNGHIINPGTIILRTSTGDKRLTLQLQHGRVLVYD